MSSSGMLHACVCHVSAKVSNALFVIITKEEAGITVYFFYVIAVTTLFFVFLYVVTRSRTGFMLARTTGKITRTFPEEGLGLDHVDLGGEAEHDADQYSSGTGTFATKSGGGWSSATGKTGATSSTNVMPMRVQSQGLPTLGPKNSAAARSSSARPAAKLSFAAPGVGGNANDFYVDQRESSEGAGVPDKRAATELQVMSKLSPASAATSSAAAARVVVPDLMDMSLPAPQVDAVGTPDKLYAQPDSDEQFTGAASLDA